MGADTHMGDIFPSGLAGKTVTKQLRQGRCSLNSECYSVAF